MLLPGFFFYMLFCTVTPLFATATSAIRISIYWYGSMLSNPFHIVLFSHTCMYSLNFSFTQRWYDSIFICPWLILSLFYFSWRLSENTLWTKERSWSGLVLTPFENIYSFIIFLFFLLYLLCHVIIAWFQLWDVASSYIITGDWIMQCYRYWC